MITSVHSYLIQWETPGASGPLSYYSFFLATKKKKKVQKRKEMKTNKSELVASSLVGPRVEWCKVQIFLKELIGHTNYWGMKYNSTKTSKLHWFCNLEGLAVSCLAPQGTRHKFGRHILVDSSTCFCFNPKPYPFWKHTCSWIYLDALF